MAEQFKIKSLQDYQKQLNTTSPLAVPKTSGVTTTETLSTQKQNLEKRLKAVGVNPDDLGKGEVDNRNIIEKTLNLTPDQNFFFDFLEVIDRPIRSVFGAAEAAVSGDSVIEGFMEGLTGDSDIMFTDILDSAGVVNKEELPGVLSFALDIGAEVLLDPLNLIPAGFLTKVLGLKSKSSLKLVDIPTTFKQMDEVAAPFIARFKNAENFATSAAKKNGFVDVQTKSRIYSKEGLDAAKEAAEKSRTAALSKKYTPGQALEIEATSIVESTIKNNPVLSDNIEVIKHATSDNKTPDITILKKVLVDGEDFWIEIGRIEAKGVDDLLGKLGEVRYMSPRIGLNVAADGSEIVDIVFTDEVLKQVSEDLGKGLQDVFNIEGGIFRNNVTLFNLFESINEVNEIVSPWLEKGVKGNLIDMVQSKLKITSVSDIKESLYNLLVGPKFASEQAIKAKVSAFSTKKGVTVLESDVDDVVKEILKLRSEFATRSKKFLNQTTIGLDYKKNKEVLDTVLRRLVDAKYKDSPFLMYVDMNKQSKILNTDQVIKSLDMTNAKFIRRGGEYRFEVYLGGRANKATGFKGTLSDYNLPDASEDFIKYLINRSDSLENMLSPVKTVTDGATKKALVEVRQPSAVMQFLMAKAADETSIIQKPVKFAIDTLEKLKYKFSSTAGYTGPFKAQLGRIQGRQAYKLNEFATRIFETEKMLKNIDPSAGKYLKDLLEMGVTRDELASGLKAFHNKTGNTVDLIDYYIRNTNNGNLAIIDSFNTDLDLKNAETALNQILEGYGIDAKARIISSSDFKGNYLKLETDLDIKEIEKLMSGNAPVFNKSFAEFSYGNFEIDKKVRDFVDSYSEDFSKMLDLHDEISSLIINELGIENLGSGVLNELGYYRHSLTREAKKALRDTSPIARSKFSQEGSNIFASRKYEAGTDAINSVAKDVMELEYDLITDDAFNSLRDMVESALLVEGQHKVLGALLQESIALDNVGSNISFFKVVENNRQAAEELGPSYRFIADGLETEFSKMFDNLDPESLAEFKGFMDDMGFVKGKTAIAINKSVYETLQGVNNAYVQVGEFLRYYDGFMNFWKSTTLVSPGFHVRNFFGNATNMYIGGMNTADIFRYQKDSVMEFQNYFRYRDAYALDGIDAIPQQFQEAFNSVKNYYDGGLAQTRKGLRDFEKIESIALQGYDPTKRGFVEGYNRVVQANFHAAEYIDDVQRFAMYRWALDQDNLFTEIGQLKKAGATNEILDKYRHKVAREKVMDALFDYTALTSFEKDYMKRLIPFYTFMKNNLVFQMKQLIDNPKKYRRLGQAYNLFNENIGGITKEDLPNYAKDNFWLALPFSVSKDDEEAISFLKLNLPPSDFAEFVEQPFKRGLSSLAAPIKLPIEYGFMRDSFTGQEFEKFPGQQRRLADEDGVLAFLRDEKGTLAVSTNPVVQKLMNDIGLRVPQNYLSIAFDILDGLMGYQSGGETVTDIMDRFSITGTQKVSQMELTKLYKDLEYLRNLKSLYEQESGKRLPSLDELGLKD